MKIVKNSKVQNPKIEVINGVYYGAIKKNILDINVVCEMDGTYCKKCQFEKECGDNAEYHVWKRIPGYK